MFKNQLPAPNNKYRKFELRKDKLKKLMHPFYHILTISKVLCLYLLLFISNMAFSQSEDDYRYIQITGYADYMTRNARNVTPHCIPVIVANDHNQNLNDTLTLGENDTIFKVNAKGLTYIKLKIYHEDHKVDVHPIIFERYGKRISIQLRDEGSLYYYLFIGSGRLPFTPIKDIIQIDHDNHHEKDYIFNDFLIENQIFSACTIYSRYDIFHERGYPLPNLFRLQPEQSMDSIGKIIENFPSVLEVNPLLCTDCFRRDCDHCWFIRNLLIDFTENVSEGQAIEILKEMGFIDIEKQPDRKVGTRMRKNLYKFSIGEFDGYSFLEKLDMLWERNDVLSISIPFYCHDFHRDD